MPDEQPEIQKTAAPDAQPGKKRGKKAKKKGFARRWIRVNFLVFLAVLAVMACVFYLVLFDPIVAWAIRSLGSRAHGAKVEVDEVRTSFFPPTLRLTNFRAANPEQPMRNAGEAKEIVASFDPFALMRARLVIHDMTVRELQFDTPRETSGALDPRAPRDPREEPPEEERDWLPTFETPDIEVILEEEELVSVERAKEAEADIEETKAKWEERIPELREKWEGREERLRETDPARAAQALAEIRRELEELRRVAGEFSDDMSRLRGRVEGVKEAVPEDVDRLKDKYALSPEGISNMARALFGEEIGKWSGRAAWAWPHYRSWRARSREKAEAPRERREGRYIAFGEEREEVVAQPAQPRLVIGRVHVSALTERGVISGEIENVTDMPSFVGQPTRFAFAAETLRNVGELNVQGVLDHVDPDNPMDTVSAVVRDLVIDRLDTAAPVSLSDGLANIDLNSTIRGASLDGLLRTQVQGARFAAAEEGQTAQTLSAALEGVSQFVLNAILRGTVDSPRVDLDTEDLDQVIAGAVQNIAAAQAQELEAGLRRAIQREIGDLDGKLGEVAGLDGQLRSILERAAGLGEGGAEGLLRGILGGREEEGEEAPSPRDRLRGIFGR